MKKGIISRRVAQHILATAIFVTLSIICLSFAPPEKASNLVIWHKDGSQIIINLAEKPKISYVGENVLIESSVTVEYPFQAIRKMTYSEDIVTGLEYPTANHKKPFMAKGNTITFFPADSDLHVRVVLMNGTVFKELIVKKGNSSSLPLEPSPANIYLICVNGVTYKIKVK